MSDEEIETDGHILEGLAYGKNKLIEYVHENNMTFIVVAILIILLTIWAINNAWHHLSWLFTA